MSLGADTTGISLFITLLNITPRSSKHMPGQFLFTLSRPAIMEEQTDEIPDNVMQHIQLSGEQQTNIENIPQGTPEWIQARKYRITASNFAAAAGWNKYKSRNELLKDLLWNTFKGNQATEWGSRHEPTARQMYVDHMNSLIEKGESEYTAVKVRQTGLFIHENMPWLGASPDGLVLGTTASGKQEKFLLEIKCPFSKKFYSPAVPEYYMCQIQGIMALMNLPFCDFMVWLPGEFKISRVQFDPNFWALMFPRLQDFYFEMYLPALQHQKQGELEPGEIHPVIQLNV